MASTSQASDLPVVDYFPYFKNDMKVTGRQMKKAKQDQEEHNITFDELGPENRLTERQKCCHITIVTILKKFGITQPLDVRGKLYNRLYTGLINVIKICGCNTKKPCEHKTRPLQATVYIRQWLSECQTPSKKVQAFFANPSPMEKGAINELALRRNIPLAPKEDYVTRTIACALWEYDLSPGGVPELARELTRLLDAMGRPSKDNALARWGYSGRFAASDAEIASKIIEEHILHPAFARDEDGWLHHTPCPTGYVRTNFSPSAARKAFQSSWDAQRPNEEVHERPFGETAFEDGSPASSSVTEVARDLARWSGRKGTDHRLLLGIVIDKNAWVWSPKGSQPKGAEGMDSRNIVWIESTTDGRYYGLQPSVESDLNNRPSKRPRLEY